MVRENPFVPSLTGRVVLILTVTDPETSASWYRSVFAMKTVGDYSDERSGVRSVCLQNPDNGVEICLRNHPAGPRQRFDETNIGLDHAELLVTDRSSLDEWVLHLDALGIAHSGVKSPEHSSNSMVTFRDPDNIQLELFWMGNEQAPQPADHN